MCISNTRPICKFRGPGDVVILVCAELAIFGWRASVCRGILRDRYNNNLNAHNLPRGQNLLQMSSCFVQYLGQASHGG